MRNNAWAALAIVGVIIAFALGLSTTAVITGLLASNIDTGITATPSGLEIYSGNGNKELSIVRGTSANEGQVIKRLASGMIGWAEDNTSSVTGASTVNVLENGSTVTTGATGVDFQAPFDVFNNGGQAEVSLDTTEISDTTFSNGSDFTWTFSGSGVNEPTLNVVSEDLRLEALGGLQSIALNDSNNSNIVVNSDNNININAFDTLNLTSQDSIDLELGNGSILDFIFDSVLEYSFSQSVADFLGNSLRNFGFIESNAATPATAEAIRLGNNEKIAWRDSGNSFNATVGFTGAGVFEFDGGSLQLNSLLSCNTLDTNASGLLACGAETVARSASIVAPLTGSMSNLGKFSYDAGVTITKVICAVDQGDVTIQLDERGKTTPNTGGTDIMTSTLACDTDAQETTGFDNAGIAAEEWVNIQIITGSGSPGALWITVIATKDN